MNPVTKNIDGKNFLFYQISPRKSLNLLLRIFKIIGAPLGTAIDSNKNIDGKNFDIGKAVTLLCDKMDIPEVENIIIELLSQVTCEGHGEVNKNFDTIFTGKISTLFKVIYISLEKEYSDFFGEKSVLQSLRGVADTNQEKPQ